MDDGTLLQQWRDGDNKAGEELFNRHFGALFRFFSSKALEAAEDLTQDTLMACVKGKTAINEEGKFRAYMFAVARRLLHQYYDKNRRRRDFDVDIGSRSVADLSPGAASVVAKKQEERLFLEALRSLPLDYQIAVELQTFEGMTGPELAAVLGVAEGTVRSRLRRARIQMEEKIRALAESAEVLQSTLTRIDEWAKNVRGQLDSP